MALENSNEKNNYYKPYSLLDFLYGIILFENPIRVEKVEKLLLEYNAKFEKKHRGVNLENLPEFFKYIELTDSEYKLIDGLTLETQITEGTSLFTIYFLIQNQPSMIFLVQNIMIIKLKKHRVMARWQGKLIKKKPIEKNQY